MKAKIILFLAASTIVLVSGETFELSLSGILGLPKRMVSSVINAVDDLLGFKSQLPAIVSPKEVTVVEKAYDGITSLVKQLISLPRKALDLAVVNIQQTMKILLDLIKSHGKGAVSGITSSLNSIYSLILQSPGLHVKVKQALANAHATLHELSGW